MKNCPRIHSLSTLNLIYHHDFDYIFHPLRTDFIGDSGSGKSMIADMLQLIFVGSGAFESATTGTDKRDPNTMVLRTAGRGSDFGYTFVNIEIKEKEFVTVGCFIQSNSTTAHSFIVQAGHNYTEQGALEAFSTPLTTADFVKDGYILPLEEFKDYINAKSLTCSSWQRLKTFHSILFQNKILPIDLTKSDKVLLDYAKILQSFSRKILDTSDSKSLQEFLFGQEQFNEIKKLYKAAVTELSASVTEYGSNLKEIEVITAKQTAIAGLKKLKDTRDQTRETWIFNNYQYLNYLKKQNKEELKKLVNKHLVSSSKLQALSTILQEKKRVLKSSLSTQEESVNLAMSLFIQSHEPHQNIQKISKWLLRFNCNVTELGEKFINYHSLLKLKNELNTLTNALHSKKLESEFVQFDWSQGYSQGRQQLEGLIERTKGEINEKKILQNFSNLDNKDSLASWAFNLNRALTLNEESVIIRFVNIGTLKPTNTEERYIPDPGVIFENFSIRDETNDGFWLNLGGVLEYIVKVKEQLLAINDKQKVKRYFQQFNASLGAEIKDLQTKQNNLELLYTSLEKLESPGKNIEAWLNSNNLENFSEDNSLHISEETFNSYLESWKNRVEIKAKYKDAQKKYEDLNNQFQEDKTTLGNIDEEITKLSQINTELESKPVIKSAYPDLFEQIDQNLITSSINTSLNENENYLSSVRKLISIEEKNLRNDQTKRIWNTLQEAIEKEVDLLKDIQGFNISPPQLQEEMWKEPVEEKSNYDSAQAQYYINYSSVIKVYILPHDAYLFRDKDDFLGLSRHLLPEAFLNAVITEEGVIEQIEEYLKRILAKNHSLNRRKLQKIDTLLDEVSSAISQQLDTIRRIKRFLNDEAKTITGGHQAYLEEYFEPLFKMDWITTFRLALKDDQGLFAQPDGIHEQLSQYISLEEKMIQAFYSSGGSHVAQPSIDKLLNPFSYYGLKFGMKGMDGDRNAGSTGQTYAAIALLCIARLSLINLGDPNNSELGVRFMAIDEAEGLGSNYDMLYNIAKKNDYQIISLSINPIDRFREKEQFMYMIHKNPDVQEKVNLTPMAIFSEEDYQKSGL